MANIATPLHERVVDDRELDSAHARSFRTERHLLRARPGVALLARLFLAPIFLVSGIAKVANPDATIAHMEAAGIPYTGALMVVAAAAEILGALSLIFGFHARTGAAGLILFLIPTSIVFHAFWTYEGAEAHMQLSNFLKNLAIMGGLGMLAAMGPGRYSIDLARVESARRRV